jgi:hypothetical protein
MKPSFTEQRDVPATDRKFRQDDEHLRARDKEDVALSPHGDKMAPRERQIDEDRDNIHPSKR